MKIELSSLYSAQPICAQGSIFMVGGAQRRMKSYRHVGNPDSQLGTRAPIRGYGCFSSVPRILPKSLNNLVTYRR